jgi:hypothetical protein
MGTGRKQPNEIWSIAQPKQFLALQHCGLDLAWMGGEAYAPVCPMIGYGGAAGGGKSELDVAVGLIACMTIPGVKVGMFRRKFTELEGSDGPIDRSKSIFPLAGAKYNSSKHLWTFPPVTGGLAEFIDDEDWTNSDAPAFRFCHCQYDKDKHSYQSQAFDILIFDEATQFTWSIVDYLLTRNRRSRASKIPVPFALFTSNPGSIGHLWYRMMFGITGRLYAPAN